MVFGFCPAGSTCKVDLTFGGRGVGLGICILRVENQPDETRLCPSSFCPDVKWACPIPEYVLLWVWLGGIRSTAVLRI